MGHEDDGARVVVQILFEPVTRLEIEMIRRLVKEEQTRPAEEQLGQGNPHLPPARERVGRTFEHRGRKSQALQHRGRAELDAVAIPEAESILEVTVARQHRLVLRCRHAGISQALFESVHLVFHRQQVAERARRLLEQTASAMREAVLRQITDSQGRGLDHTTRIGLVEPGHDPEQGRLSRAVRTA